MDLIIAEIRKIPPVTRFLVGSSLGVSIPVIMKIVSPYTVVFIQELVTKKFEIWRLYTSFFLGGSGISYIFDLVMLYRTADDIESRSYQNRSADLAWQTFWACGAIVVATIPLRAFVFFRSLLVCLVYVYSALAPAGAMTSLMGLVTIPIKFYPYVLIGMDLVMGGASAAALSVAGAAVGHLWWWTVWGGDLGGQGLLAQYSTAPAWLRNWFGEGARPGAGRAPAAGGAAAGLAQAGIHVTAPRAPVGARAPTTQTTQATGYAWGAGRRLGQ